MMVLQFQKFELPIVGGLAQEEDGVLTMQPTEMVNCVERKTGSIEKRYGYTALSTGNTRLSGSTCATAESLFTHGDELLRVGAGVLDAQLTIVDPDGTTDWVGRDYVPDALCRLGPACSRFSTLLYPIDPVTVVSGGYIATAYINVEGSSSRIMLEFVNEGTGVRPTPGSSSIVDSVTNAQKNPRIVAFGTTLGVFWFEETANVIKARFYNMTTTRAIGSVQTIATSVESRQFDVAAKSASEFAVVYVDSAASAIKITVVNSANVSSYSATVVATQTNTSAISAHYTSDRFWIAWSRLNGGTAEHRACTLNATTWAADATAYTVETVASAASAANIGVTQLTATRAMIAWTMANDGVHLNEVTYAAAVLTAAFSSGSRRILDAYLVSAPLAVSATRAFMLVENVHGTHGTYFLLDAAAQDGGAFSNAVSARIVGSALPRQAIALRAAGGGVTWSFAPRETGTARLTAAADGYLVPVVVQLDATYSVSAGAQGVPMGRVVNLRWLFDAAWERTACETGGVTYISGGVPSWYDGTQCAEIGFAYEPDADRLAAFTPSNGAGTLTSGATYSYKFVFAHPDSLGNVHRSAPSKAVTVTLGATDDTVAGTIPQLHLTNRYDVSAGASGTAVQVEVYRTAANGSTYYIHSTVRNIVNSAPIAFTDLLPDSALTAGEALDESILPSMLPPSSGIVLPWRGSLVLGDTDDGSIYFSRGIVPGEGVAINGALTQAPFDGGIVTGLADLDGTLAIFKARAIYRIGGSGIADNGASDLTSPELVTSGGIGCAFARSVVAGPDGVEFASERGFALLDRSWGVTAHGRPVEDSFPGSGTYVGAALVPGQRLVRFMRAGVTAGQLATRDCDHSAQYQRPVWSIDSLRVPSLDTTASPKACCIHMGRFTWIDSSGQVFYENATTHADSGGGVTTWVPMAFSTGFEKADGVQGFHRVRRIGVDFASVSDCGLTLTATSDLGTQAKTWTDTEVDALPAVRTGIRMHSQYQKVSRMKLRLQDIEPTSPGQTVGTGAGIRIRNIAVELGLKGGLTRRSSAATK